MGNGISCMCGGGNVEEDEVDDSKLQFLHGKLRVHVMQAEGLPDTDTCCWNISSKDVTDPYVTGQLGEARIFKSKYVSNELNPVWDEVFNIYVCHSANSLKIGVRDKEHIGDAFIASCSIRVADIIDGSIVDGWFDLYANGNNHGRIQLSVQFTAKENLEEEKALDIPESYFDPKENNRVVLYQDADTPQLPVFDAVTHPDGSPYQTTRAWQDLFQVLNNAQKFIYITGWSVYTAISLVRGEDPNAGESNVGELLKKKADEGVKVLLMVWNEKFSTESSPGLMGTHDEDTRKYFEGTSVVCKLVGRIKFSGMLASEFVGSCYTHHQKTVIADAPMGDGSDLRRVVAFIGGLDITDGRYDTPEYPLWKTINTLHAGDFYNNCIPGVTSATGPREPWHDCHARVEGPAALDIMKNFEERWMRQAENDVQTLYHLNSDEFDKEASAIVPEHEGGPWTVQLFRSITSDSCTFDFEKHKCLHSKFGKFIEETIMRSMVVNIRNAQNFIYMENQYFLGSAYCWYGDRSTLTMHIVPREITQKIVEKIEANQDFKAYILIPMFPEGDPSSAAIQEILFWQYRTMETMYRRIAKAISDHGLDRHPTDYLNFYCLGKRESPDEMPADQFQDPTPGSLVQVTRDSRRHPIYVHSKMSIFDDQYVIVGSANVNQRSLGGNRDSEIAIGAYQPDYTLDSPNGARGDVHTYRMALWAAHLGGAEEALRQPETDECLEKVREITQEYWRLYTADVPDHSDVHLLPYPMRVDSDGNVGELDAPWDCFPDTSAKVRGAKSGYLPMKLTT